MPAKLEEIRRAVQRSGKPKDQAYAIATAVLKKKARNLKASK